MVSPKPRPSCSKAEGADYDAAIALVPSGDGSSLRELGERNLPRGPRGATRENPAGPTNGELEVLPLLAQGLRNAEIAQRLVVTPKSVDHHVSSILRKLGVTNRDQRGQAAAAADRLGVVAGEADASPTAG